MVGCILLPIHTLNNTSGYIYNSLCSKNGAYYIAAYVLLKVLGYGKVLIAILSFVGRLYNFIDHVLDFLTQIWIIPLVSLYVVAYCSWIFIQNSEELRRKKKFVRTLSLPIW